jgi:glycerol-3-phosphate acyltransferase PlsX
LDSAPPHGGLPIRFVGNVEGSDLLAAKADVIVTDGFTGNVALKTLEGAGAFAAQQMRDAVMGSAAARFGALFQRRRLRELSGRMDAETYGGAALLGLEGTVVIAHGASTAKGITSACRLAAELAQGQITEKIKERFGPGRSSYFLRRSRPDSQSSRTDGQASRTDGQASRTDAQASRTDAQTSRTDAQA